MVDRRSWIVDTNGPRASDPGTAESRKSKVEGRRLHEFAVPTFDVRHSTFGSQASHASRVTGHYDVVVAGASFAGLAVAQRVRGRVLLLDKDPIGEGNTSACGAPVSLVRAMDAGGSIQQIQHALILHTSGGRVVWPLPEPFCTFDYRQFCTLAFRRTGAEFRRAAVLGRRGATVFTAGGDVEAPIHVDATGWRAALVGGPSSPYVNRHWMAFGIESEIECRFEPGLHFYFLPEVRDGYAWVFPSGECVRFGVLSYRGRTRLRPALERFMARFGLRPAGIHGGYLASGLRRPVVDGVFVVGDASGHCLPVTGEGIRTAVLAGSVLGDALQGVLDGRLTLEAATDTYREFVERFRRKYRALSWGNLALLALPRPAIGHLAKRLARPRTLQMFMHHYMGIFQRAPASYLQPAPE